MLTQITEIVREFQAYGGSGWLGKRSIRLSYLQVWRIVLERNRYGQAISPRLGIFGSARRYTRR